MGDKAGVEAARRLASRGTVRVEPGLTDHELVAVEAKFGFEFADDRRALLAVALPVWAAGHDDEPDKVSHRRFSAQDRLH